MPVWFRQKVQAMPRQVGAIAVDNRIQVVAGILQDADARYLITDRVNANSMQDFWEFPGGKIIQGESTADALSRELDEEHGILLTAFDHFFSLKHDYQDLQVAIEFFLVGRQNN